MKQTSRSKNLIVVIILLSLVIRLVSLNQSLWLDEAINVSAARDLPLGQLLTKYTIGDFHPPLYHFILWVWLNLFPISEIVVRLPSVIFAVATVYLVWKIGKLLEEKHNFFIATLAAILLATSGLHLYYSQEARMYSLAAFTSTLTLYALIRSKSEPTRTNKLLLFFSLVTTLLSDYQPYLVLPFLFFFAPGITSLALLAIIPWWPTLLRQVEHGLATAASFPAWGDVVGRLTLKAFLLVPVKFLVGRVSIDDNRLFAAVLVLPLLSAGYLLFKATRERRTTIHLVTNWFLAAMVTALVVGRTIPIFSYFRFLFLLPPLYLLLAKGAMKLSGRTKTAAIAILLTTNLISSGAYLVLPRFHREDWRGLNHFATTVGSDTLVVFPNLAQSAGFSFYNTSNLPMQDKTNLDLSGKPDHVLFIRYVVEIFDPQETVKEHLREEGYIRRQERTFNGILVWHYLKE